MSKPIELPPVLPPNLARLEAILNPAIVPPTSPKQMLADRLMEGGLSEARALVEENSRLKERLLARMAELQEGSDPMGPYSFGNPKTWACDCDHGEYPASVEALLHAPDCPWALDMWLAGRTDVKIREAKGDE